MGESSGMEQSNSNMRHPSSNKSPAKPSKSGPVVLLLWVWDWFATLPKTVTNLYADIKNGELLSKFTMVDAMLQFIFAVATSCHPQEDGLDGDEQKSEKSSPANLKGDLNVFGGSGRTLRSRVIEAES